MALSLNPVLAVALLTATATLVAGTCNNPQEWLPGNTASHMGIWPEGIVKFKLHRSLTQDDISEVKHAMLEIQRKTCIRFLPKNGGDTDYTSIELDNNICGLSHVCRKGGEQLTSFGQRCRNTRSMIHQLGHTLCMGHEQTRRDRDDFQNFGRCKENQIPIKDSANDLRGTLYDYASQMHGNCRSCEGGWPRQDEVTSCGQQVEQGLSVMDADKLNEMYDCGGCFSHRWRPIDALTTEERSNLVGFGRTHQDTQFYACRGLINGELCVGKSNGESCWLSYHGREYVLNRNVQVFTDPSRSGSYRVVNITDFLEGRDSGKPVPSARTRDADEGSTGYIAVALTEHHNGDINEYPVGKVFKREMNKAYFPFFGEVQVIDEFGIVVCDN